MNCIATIVSANYLAYARTLAESVAVHQSDCTFIVLIVDRKTSLVQRAVKQAGLQAIYASDLGLEDFEDLAFKFELVEFNTALKPSFLKYLFRQGFDRVVYLDPDIRLFSSLAPVHAALDTAEMVLTPHSLTPVMDGRRPSDVDFLRNGAYNLGFVGLKRGVHSGQMLDWWEDRCLSYGFNDLGFGTFVDQKWMDLVPAYFDHVAILRTPACNVAYWNLHERTLAKAGGTYLVGSEDLCFFHFSGVKASAPHVLSRHQTRHVVRPDSVLAELLRDYCDCLLRHGHADFSTIDYSFGSFDDGVAINVFARKLSCIVGTEGRPFDPAGPLRQQLQRLGGGTVTHRPAGSENTLNFDQTAARVRLSNVAVRALARVIGYDRMLSLARYLAFLTRESNLARVLCREPFDFSHSPSRTRRLNAGRDV